MLGGFRLGVKDVGTEVLGFLLEVKVRVYVFVLLRFDYTAQKERAQCLPPWVMHLSPIPFFPSFLFPIFFGTSTQHQHFFMHRKDLS